MDAFRQDLRVGWRALRARPAFSVVAVLTLALGIAVNSTMFSVVNGVLLERLPYPEPERLVLVRVSIEGRPALPSVAPPEVVDLQERAGVFEDVGAIRDASATLSGDGLPQQIRIGGVTWNFLSVLGVQPLLGRGFLEADAAPSNGPPSVVVLGYGLWQSRFGADVGIVGRQIRLDGNPTTVVGVLPPGTEMLLPREAGIARDLDAWWPFTFDFRAAPRLRWMRAVGRLSDGVALDQARAAVRGLSDQLNREIPMYQQQSFEYQVLPLHAALVHDVRRPVLVLFGAVGFVLLIACANVASLLLARAAEREREMGTRAALGAGRRRIVRQLLTEGLVLAGLGSALGLLLSQAGITAVARLAPANLPRMDHVMLDGRVVAFTLLVSLFTVALFAVVPALSASRLDLAEILRGGSRVSAGLERGRLRRALVVGEIALSLVLLAGAGLMLRSFLELHRVRPGFDPEGLVTLQVDVPFTRYSFTQVDELFRKLTEATRARPGIVGVGASFPLPMSGRFWTNEYAYDEHTEREWGSLEADNHVVLPGFFETLGTRLLRGRFFEWDDNQSDRKVVIVDEKMAAQAWPGQDPIGRRLLVLLPNGREWVEVIGVVEHIRQDHPGVDGREQTYMLPALWPQLGFPLVLRSSLPPSEVVEAVRQELRRLDPDLAVYAVHTMPGYLDEVMASHRFAMLLMSVFAALATLMASVGLYGTIAYAVSQRHHEIGIRMALGAGSRQVVRLVVAQGLGLVGAGISLGILASLLLTRTLSWLLYEVPALDAWTYAGTTLLLASLALLACLVPAWRATRVAPMIVLRYE